MLCRWTQSSGSPRCTRTATSSSARASPAALEARCGDRTPTSPGARACCAPVAWEPCALPVRAPMRLCACVYAKCTHATLHARMPEPPQVRKQLSIFRDREATAPKCRLWLDGAMAEGPNGDGNASLVRPGARAPAGAGLMTHGDPNAKDPLHSRLPTHAEVDGKFSSVGSPHNLRLSVSDAFPGAPRFGHVEGKLPHVTSERRDATPT